jgi:predicted site-specific integrase-resolvase
MQRDGLLTVQEVGRMLNVSVKTLQRWRLNHVGPHSFKVGGQIRYRPETIERYIQEQEEKASA